ncbi:photosystem II S4 domain protein [Prochlorococcus marinus]|uniref:Photosystem II S4 domain protein n=1 Tax=Prochlorococcus marinus XMU1408 TaxID=2213228 RepID=A0A318QWX7_PROMR|nr:photosystem II S4 domain protein [Prochlorococcus marinus]MBW3042541.1 photosystem II S4 domain protein [Prochlorococcus marinus str. XMU1408]PYE01266.1 photosystem II S4 domain protein [Prochlorococcus marinus XMU1408]
MHLPKEKILFNSPFRKELEILIEYAEKALTKRQAIWSPFVSAQLIEEVKNKFHNLNDITCSFNGGFPSAERQKICFVRSEAPNNSSPTDIPIKGIYIKGNFLFDRAKPNDFRNVLKELGLDEDEIGDIWLIRDRGAQAICSQKGANLMHEKTGKLREVTIKIDFLDIREMEIPFTRAAKTINTVEASTRIDAIASAGFGLSRSKITTQIKQGCLRLNWRLNYQPSKLVNIGDLIHLEKKGSLKILDIDKTKKERWRIKLLRQ